MGRVVTPKFRVVVETAGTLRLTPFAWRVDEYGRPTPANLAAWAEKLVASFQPGGANAHCGDVRVLSARVEFNDASGRAVSEWSR